MTISTNKAFLSTVTASMFSHKRYPSADDYTNVARTIVQKYPFMKSPTGKPYVSFYFCVYVRNTAVYRTLVPMQGAIVIGLKNRFKERRRVKTPRTLSPKVQISKPPKSPSVKVHEVPASEDATSFERHNRMLAIEFRKATPLTLLMLKIS